MLSLLERFIGYMDQRKALVAVSIVVVLVLAIIVGTIFYLTKIFKSSNQPSTKVVTSSSQPAASGANAPSDNLPSTQPGQPQTSAVTTPPANPNLKTYNGNGFSLQYPKNWGLLSCSNSNNFEFDPYNSQNTQIACD